MVMEACSAPVIFVERWLLIKVSEPSSRGTLEEDAGNGRKIMEANTNTTQN
jgi:hypothetical protein